MRHALHFLAILPIAGCFSTWDLAAGGPQIGECRDPFYEDIDGDGWGDPRSVPQAQCEGDVETKRTARNARDCDDATTSVTGMIGSICPSELTIGDTDYAGVVYGSEFVVVYGVSEAVWGDAADQACGEIGWGGHLATFDGGGDYEAVVAALDDVLGDDEPYAGFVGIEASGGSWDWFDGSAKSLNWCEGAPDVADVDPTWTRPALIRPDDGGPWCLGLPDEAVPIGDDSDYGWNFGHFICERDAPNPSSYAATPAVFEEDTATTE